MNLELCCIAKASNSFADILTNVYIMTIQLTPTDGNGTPGTETTQRCPLKHERKISEKLLYQFTCTIIAENLEFLTQSNHKMINAS